jgi:hypothetical protein
MATKEVTLAETPTLMISRQARSTTHYGPLCASLLNVSPACY